MILRVAERSECRNESDGILEDLEVSLASLREELHIFAENRGAMVGNITITDKGDDIDCRRMGSGGYAIPSITEGDIIQFKKIDADFVLTDPSLTISTSSNTSRWCMDIGSLFRGPCGADGRDALRSRART